MLYYVQFTSFSIKIFILTIILRGFCALLDTVTKWANPVGSMVMNMLLKNTQDLMLPNRFCLYISLPQISIRKDLRNTEKIFMKLVNRPTKNKKKIKNMVEIRISIKKHSPIVI